jgi:cyclic pyranopterin phosphate synthase
MVDVSAKHPVRRTARAYGKIRLAPKTIELVGQNALTKGDVLSTARIAGIMAAKRTAELIPLCHNIEIEHVSVDLKLVSDGVEITSTAVCTDKTGIEMEALTAVSVAALTVWDMCKAVDKAMHIEGIGLIEKTKEEVAL